MLDGEAGCDRICIKATLKIILPCTQTHTQASSHFESIKVSNQRMPRLSPKYLTFKICTEEKKDQIYLK